MPLAHRAQQGHLLQARIAVLARALAVLVVGWIPLDLYALERRELAGVLPLRLLVALALLLIARVSPRLPPSTLLRLLLWVQVAGFGAMSLALDPDQATVMHLNYWLSPFLVVAQLAALPLPWIRSMRAALIPAWLLLVPAVLGDLQVDAEYWHGVWLFVTIAAIAAWSGHSQLRLMVDLLGARRDAMHDPLTGLANRRAADRRLAAEHALALRRGTPLSLLMLDIDRFKRINDTWDHDEGDRVLAEVARRIRHEVRAGDLATRYGGEEFLVLLPDTALQAASDVAERIRGAIASEPVALGGGRVVVTASVGVAQLRDGEDNAALVARADTALYRAKQQGRNRCVADAATASAGA